MTKGSSHSRRRTGVQSTVPSYLQLLRIPAGAARRQAWHEFYEAAHPSIFESYYSDWGNPDGRDEAADRVAELAPLVKEREARAAAAVARAGQDLVELGLLDDAAIPTVLLVGVGTSNAWATTSGQPTVYIALESLPAAPFDTVLVLHEAVHYAQLKRAAPDWPEHVGARLHQEGIATALTRQVHPGLADSAYLWFDGAHQQWALTCAQREHEILRRLQANFDSNDPRIAEEFFGNKPAILPTRCGYWAGDRIAQQLLQERDMTLAVLGSLQDAVSHARSAIAARLAAIGQ